MKRLRFYYQGVVIDKNSELLINEPRRYKMITEKIPITDIENFMKNKFGIDYSYLKYICELHARQNAIILDAIVNGPINGEGFEEDNNSYI